MTGTTGQKIHAYRQSAVSTASPLELVIMLYDGALRFLEAGRRAVEEGDLERQHENLTKAQRILTELSVCLDMEQGGEVALNLMNLYTFMNNRLTEANINDDAEAVGDVARLLAELREAWVTVSAQSGTEKERQLDAA